MWIWEKIISVFYLYINSDKNDIAGKFRLVQKESKV